MTELENKSVNQEKPESNLITGRIMNRLLKRKSDSGVILPKIRSRIAKITHNSDRIRENRLILPGNSRRENLKTFGEKLQNKQFGNLKNASKKVAKKGQAPWDSMEMLLPNGGVMDRTHSNFEQTNVGLPAGGQVITPFNPPVSTNSEPSFIERRRARLKAQEEKKTKPQEKKTHPSSRLYSRVEEIIPQSNRRVESKPDVPQASRPVDPKPDEKIPQASRRVEPKAENKIESSKVAPEKEKEVPQKPIKDQKQVSKNETIEASIKEEKPSGKISTKPANGDSVVQRLPETERVTKSGVKEKQTFPEEISTPEKLPSDLKEKFTSDIQKDLHSLAPRKSLQRSEDEKEQSVLPEIKKIKEEVSSQKEVIKEEIKKITKPESKVPVIRADEEKRDKINPNQPKASTDRLEEKTGHLPIQKIPTDSRISKSSINTLQQEKIETGFDENKLSETPASPEVSVGDKKLELPLVAKIKTTKEEIDDLKRSETKSIEKEVSEKSIKQDFHHKEDQPDILKKQDSQFKKDLPEKPIKQVFQQAKDRPVKKLQDDSVEQKTDVPMKLDKRVVSEERKMDSPLELPLVQPRSKKISMVKPFITRQKEKNQKITQVLQKPVFKRTSGSPATYSRKSNLIQRQMDLDKSNQVLKTKTDLPTQDVSILRSTKPTSEINLSSQKEIPVSDNRQPFSSGIESTDMILKTPPSPLKIGQDKPARKIGVLRKYPQKILKKESFSRKTSPTVFSKTQDKPGITKRQGMPLDNSGDPNKSFGVDKVSSTDKILITSRGRQAIQRQIQTTAQKLEKSQPAEGNLPFIVPIINKEIGREKFDFSDKPGHLSESKLRSEPIREKKSQKASQRSMPVITKNKTKPYETKKPTPQLDLPVKQTKKVEPEVQYFKPDLAVSGPVVQRILDQADEIVDSTPPSTQQEVKPDLELLAKEIYPIIKRWIAIEKERTTGRLY